MSAAATCPYTGKTRHPNRGAARHAARQLATAEHIPTRAIQIYTCGCCGDIHIGHRNRRYHTRRHFRRHARQDAA